MKTLIIYSTFLLFFLFKLKLCLVLDTLPVFVNISIRCCQTGWAKNKLQTLAHIFTKYFLQVCISQGSAATQLRCGVMSSNHFSTECAGKIF